jgi:hypothetical protein
MLGFDGRQGSPWERLFVRIHKHKPRGVGQPLAQSRSNLLNGGVWSLLPEEPDELNRCQQSKDRQAGTKKKKNTTDKPARAQSRRCSTVVCPGSLIVFSIFPAIGSLAWLQRGLFATENSGSASASKKKLCAIISWSQRISESPVNHRPLPSRQGV